GRERARLRGREPPAATDEAAHGAAVGGVGVPRRARHAQKNVPSRGEEADAKRLRGMRPARKASRPASTALRIAEAMSTGSRAPEMAVFSNKPSQASSIAIAASDAVPKPASTRMGTDAFSTIVR